ncbi:hypothetical protein BLNAU_22048 [Blattamonas nauphoetae]|uniref:Uncharacterized protein n=1 Tax=Blattamonas nauphoetae TaxID=2049346 RepID=A0ABQ9WU63_9EUKA|nr:hypothetical protein BLNAU_22048 [Blattamonas nauphoetae]
MLSPLHRKERLTWAETDRATHPTQDDAKTKQSKTEKKEGVAKTSKEGNRRQKLENETRRKQGGQVRRDQLLQHHSTPVWSELERKPAQRKFREQQK